jgi:hypothetical protein
LGFEFKKIHIERLADDICMIKRFPNNFERATVLITRLNYDPQAPLADIDVEMPGWVKKVKKLFFFRKEFEILDEEIPRIRAQVVEQNDLGCFGSVSHRCPNQR